MRLPPPIRITTPLVALVFGLVTTWFDYRLNLDLDVARHLREIRERVDSSGSRLARASAPMLASGDRSGLQALVEAIPDVPQIQIIGVVNESGRIMADSTGALRGQLALETSLAPAAALINPPGQPAVQHPENTQVVVSAHPFRIGVLGTGWALQVFDVTEAIAVARTDARTQLGWMASAMALLSFALWAVLHFTFATRIGRLADGVLLFGEGRTEAPPRLAGGDEVGKLSGAISTMAAKLRRREVEQVRLEREVLEISESERRRIGHDLHDSLGQRLTAASMTMNAFIGVLKANAPALAERGEDLGSQLREAIAEVRLLSHGLAPVGLVDDGLVAALTSLAENVSRGRAVRCVFECAEPVRLTDAGIANHLYRIAQEAVNNAVKHAAPSEIRIALESRDHTLVLEVDDDGEGLGEIGPTADGIGLRVMRYRARLIEGDLGISSPPTGGTRISCRLKLPA